MFRLAATISLALAFAPALSAEPFRPGYHFTPEKNWMNDPNGMVYQDGEYHLFYQYNPFGDKWGHMSWGHAVSKDLLAWEQLDIAIPEKDGIMAFSGSAVIDWKNSSGLGKKDKPAMVAIYTGHQDGLQDQRLAYSTDNGRTWDQFSGNPVLDIGQADFRDPKVFWHDSSKQWIMAISLSTAKKVSFYGSPDLKKWTHLSDFGPVGALGGIWECPDLFELPIDGEPGKTRWVLLLNMNPGAPAGGSGCQYFIGTFDGKTFTLDADFPKEEDLNRGKVYADFENDDYGVWSAEGASFEHGPARPADGGISGFQGAGLANSFGGSDEAVGTLVSPTIQINDDWMTFLIGGGNHPGKLGIRLTVDGKTVREETGPNHSDLVHKHWNISEFRGKRGKIEIFDDYTGSDWGHITVDEISLGSGTPSRMNEAALWADYGADYYAAVTWSDIPKKDGRRLSIGWMSNWHYAEVVPTSPWRGAMTLPRELGLRKTPEGIRLVQKPVKEMENLRANPAKKFLGGTIEDAGKWLSNLPETDGRLELKIKLSGIGKDKDFSLSFGSGENAETLVGYVAEEMFVDRRKSGITDFHPDFATVHYAPVSLSDGTLILHVFLDSCSIEVFAADGTVTFTDLIFPPAGPVRIGLSGSKSIKVDAILIQSLKTPGSNE